MRFLNITVRNFFSFSEASLNLANRGHVFVEGINQDSDAADGNGAGKSALIVEALLWGLFGKTARGVVGTDVIRRGSTDGTSVTVDWEQNGRQFRVDRIQTDKGGMLAFCDNTHDLTTTDKRRTQAEIERVLGFNRDVALYALVLGQKSLSFASATDAMKKEIFETIFRFDILRHASTRAKAKQQELTTSIHGYATTYDTLYELLGVKHTKLEHYQIEASQWEANKAKDLQELTDKIVTSHARLDGLDGCLQEHALAVKQVEELAETESEQLATQNKFRRANDEVNHLMYQIEALEGTLNHTQAYTQVETKCPRCGQQLPPHALAEEKVRAQQECEEAAKLQTEINKLTEQLRLCKIYVEALQLTLDECTQQLTQSSKLRADEVRFLQATMEYDQEVQQVKALQAKIEVVKATNCSASTLVDAIQQEIDEIVEKAAEVSGQKVEAINKRAYYEFWVTGFGKKGLQSYILDTILPFLTTKANEYASILCGGEISISFSTTRQTKTGTTRDDFTVSCTNQHGADIYHGQSGGEQDRIDLAIALALQDLMLARLGTELNYSVFDECIPYTDRAGVERFIRLLRQLKRSTIFVVSHNPFYLEYFDQHLCIVKHDGVSRIGEV